MVIYGAKVSGILNKSVKDVIVSCLLCQNSDNVTVLVFLETIIYCVSKRCR